MKGFPVNGSFSRPRPGRSNNIFNIRSLKGADEEFLSLATNMFFTNDILVKNSKIFNVHSSHLAHVTCLFMILEDAENKNTTRLGSWLQAANSGVLHAQPLLLPNAFDLETSFQQGRKLQFSLEHHWPLVTFRSCSNDLR